MVFFLNAGRVSILPPKSISGSFENGGGEEEEKGNVDCGWLFIGIYSMGVVIDLVAALFRSECYPHTCYGGISILSAGIMFIGLVAFMLYVAESNSQGIPLFYKQCLSLGTVSGALVLLGYPTTAAFWVASYIAGSMFLAGIIVKFSQLNISNRR